MKKSITDVEEPEGNEKSIPTYQERESEAIIPRNSWELEWKEKTIKYDSIKIYLENTWHEKEFWPKILSTTSSSFLDDPPSSFRCHSHY